MRGISGEVQWTQCLAREPGKESAPKPAVGEYGDQRLQIRPVHVVKLQDITHEGRRHQSSNQIPNIGDAVAAHCRALQVGENAAAGNVPEEGLDPNS